MLIIKINNGLIIVNFVINVFMRKKLVSDIKNIVENNLKKIY